MYSENVFNIYFVSNRSQPPILEQLFEYNIIFRSKVRTLLFKKSKDLSKLLSSLFLRNIDNYINIDNNINQQQLYNNQLSAMSIANTVLPDTINLYQTG